MERDRERESMRVSLSTHTHRERERNRNTTLRRCGWSFLEMGSANQMKEWFGAKSIRGPLTWPYLP
jgi:hypothetical protein